jgi:CAAX protease family protein
MTVTQINSESLPAVDTSALTAWLKQHPVIGYFLLAFAGTWLLDLPMVLGKDGLGLLPYHVPFAIYVILFLLGSYSGPTLAALMVTKALEGKAGLRKFFSRYAQWRVQARWYLVAVFGFPILYIVSASVLLHGLPIDDLRANGMTFFSTYLPALLIFPAFITWGEEPGWRGFALTRMQESYSPVVASLTVGFMHGLWHLPVFLLVYGPPALGPFDLIGFARNIFGIMMISVIWTWIFNIAKGSILIAVLLHASLNATQAWMHILIPNYPSDAGKVASVFYIVAALAVVFFTKGRLGYEPE